MQATTLRHELNLKYFAYKSLFMPKIIIIVTKVRVFLQAQVKSPLKLFLLLQIFSLCSQTLAQVTKQQIIIEINIKSASKHYQVQSVRAWLRLIVQWNCLELNSL